MARLRASILLFAWLAALTLGASVRSALADLADPGPYPSGWRTVTVTRANATTFTARLHYPAVAPGGQDAAFDPSGGPYPAIGFGHGFVQAVTQYQSTCQHLATRGYLVLAPESEGGLSPSHANFALDLRQSLTWLEQQNALPSSPYFNRVNIAAFGLCGHSMGGGASILATAADTRVVCLANMAAAETTPSAIAAMPSIHVPVFLITGSQDGIVAPAGNGLAMYNAGTAPKQYPLITGGFHCGFTDASFLFCDSGGISRTIQLAITRRMLTAFFDLNLKSDQSVWTTVWGPDAPPSGGVTATSVSGIGVTAAASSVTAAPGGESTPISITITNSGPVSCSYTLQAQGASGWSAILDPTQTPALAPGSFAVANLRVWAPGLAGAAAGSILVSARSDRDQATRSFGVVAGTRRACIADWNGTDGLNVQDIFAFLNDWFESRADFNGSSGTTIQDIFDFLNSWFSGCP